MGQGQRTVGFEGAGPHNFGFCVGNFSRGADVVGVVVVHMPVLHQGQRFEAERFKQIRAARFGTAITAGVAHTLIDFTQQHITIPVKRSSADGALLCTGFGGFTNPPAQCVVGVAGNNPRHVHFNKLVLGVVAVARYLPLAWAALNNFFYAVAAIVVIKAPVALAL